MDFALQPLHARRLRDPFRASDRRLRRAAALGACVVSLRKRSVTIAGHSTSVSLEDTFWDALHEIAAARGVGVGDLVAEIDAARDGNLSSALRVYALDYFRNRSAT